MDRPPERATEGVIRGPMLRRAWLFLGLIVAALQMGGFFYALTKSGWSPGDPVGPGDPLHHAYQQATTMTFLGMIAGQIGTAFAVRTQRASLRSVGVFSNPYLLAGIAGELVLVAIFVYTPVFQSLLGTAPLPPSDLLLLVPYPFIVWGADELRRYIVRRRVPSPRTPPPPARDAAGRTARASAPSRSSRLTGRRASASRCRADPPGTRQLRCERRAFAAPPPGPPQRSVACGLSATAAVGDLAAGAIGEARCVKERRRAIVREGSPVRVGQRAWLGSRASSRVIRSTPSTTRWTIWTQVGCAAGAS